MSNNFNFVVGSFNHEHIGSLARLTLSLPYLKFPDPLPETHLFLFGLI